MRNIAEHFGASTEVLLGDTKNVAQYREDAGLNKYKALFTRPRPEAAVRFSLQEGSNRREADAQIITMTSR